MGNFIIITLISVFGAILTTIGLRLIRGQKRMEHRQAVALAALRAGFGAPPLTAVPDRPQHPRPTLTFIKGGAAPVIALLYLARRHAWHAVGVGASAATAGIVAGALAVGHGGGAAPATGTGAPSAGLTGATAPASASAAPSSAASGSAPPATYAASAPPANGQTIEVFAAEAAHPSSGTPTTPNTSPASSTPAPTATHPARSPLAGGPAPSPTSGCLATVELPPILGACVL